MGSRLAARMAGNIPLAMPTMARIIVAVSNVLGATSSVISPAEACEASALYRVRVPTDKEMA